MGLFDAFKKKPEVKVEEKPKVEKKKVEKSAKDLATEKGEPVIGEVNVALVDMSIE